MDSVLQEKIRAHKTFYRDNFRRGSTVLGILLFIILGLTLAILYFSVVRPLSDFYATSSNGNLTQLTPLSTPNYSHTPLIK